MIIGCLGDRIGRARILDAIRGEDQVAWSESFDDLLRDVGARPSEVSLVVVGGRDAVGEPPFRLIADLRRLFPTIAILGFSATRSPEDMEQLRRMAVAGVHHLILDTTADSRNVVRLAIESTRRQCAADQIYTQIVGGIPESLRQVVRFALDNPARTTSVSALARELGINRKTLRNWCVTEDFLSPRDLLRWCRLLLAASMLNWNGRTVASVALELDYPSDNALRISIRRQLQVRPSALRKGGVDRAVNAFLACVARSRTGTTTAVA